MEIPEGASEYALLHTHAAHNEQYLSYQFSEGDIDNINGLSMDSYLVTPAGQLLFMDVITNTSVEPAVVSNIIPSDPKSPNRATTIKPKDTSPRINSPTIVEQVVGTVSSVLKVIGSIF